MRIRRNLPRDDEPFQRASSACVCAFARPRADPAAATGDEPPFERFEFRRQSLSVSNEKITKGGPFRRRNFPLPAHIAPQPRPPSVPSAGPSDAPTTPSRHGAVPLASASRAAQNTPAVASRPPIQPRTGRQQCSSGVESSLGPPPRLVVDASPRRDPPLGSDRGRRRDPPHDSRFDRRRRFRSLQSRRERRHPAAPLSSTRSRRLKRWEAPSAKAVRTGRLGEAGRSWSCARGRPRAFERAGMAYGRDAALHRRWRRCPRVDTTADACRWPRLAASGVWVPARASRRRAAVAGVARLIATLAALTSNTRVCWSPWGLCCVHPERDPPRSTAAPAGGPPGPLGVPGARERRGAD